MVKQLPNRIFKENVSHQQKALFYHYQCEPAWLSRQIREHGPLVDGADHLFVRDLNLRDVTAFLSHYIAGKVGHWSRVTERLARVFEPATAPTA